MNAYQVAMTEVTALQRRVLDVLGAEPQSVQELATNAGLYRPLTSRARGSRNPDIHTTRNALVYLSRKGLVSCQADGCWRRLAPAGAREPRRASLRAIYGRRSPKVPRATVVP